MRKIWKRVLAVLAAGALMLACAACSGGNENADVTLDVGALADRLASELTFQDQLTALEGDAGLNIYGLDSSTAAQHYTYTLSITTLGGQTAQEIEYTINTYADLSFDSVPTNGIVAVAM